MGMGMPSGDTALIPDISKAIVGEAQAYQYYDRLAQLAPNEQDRQTIRKIQRDEARHYHMFTMILRQLGGQMPHIPGTQLPVTYREGLLHSVRDELETSAFYQEVASRASDHRIEMQFMHASHDEQRHAAWFQYMLGNLPR